MLPLHKTTQIDIRPREEVQVGEFSPGAGEMLQWLRLVALDCRAAARTDLFDACAVLSTSETVAKTAHAEVLMRCLSQALQKEAVLYRPGVEAVSFDEAWLLRAAEAAAQANWSSFEFLLRSRVPASVRRNLGSLIVTISSQFALT
ncbi:hypothetical protein [Litoreibacter roseus]|uniref:Uncharacterized protein n=1 Tax=Litoreibacter roseus TaxID=2601869 RepID=A0A6N6JJC6_9RHOB|nr:hypothetical protein [Litoreibacter roseus]GFE66234.1 hypothetical protein KIN_33080 [Litoreibacter roseus]